MALAVGAVTMTAQTPHQRFSAGTALTAAEASVDEADWQNIGECAYTDDLATTFWSVGTQTYNVTVQQDAKHPGMYRIVNPWANYPAPERLAIETHEDYPGELLLGDEYYILIDATNPEKVKIKPSPLGIVYKPIKTEWNDDYTESTTTQDYRLTTAYGKSELIGKYNISEADADKACGTLVDGVITFPQRQAIYVISENEKENLDWHIGNRFGGFQLVLTGTTVPVNYDFDVVTNMAYCPSAAGNYQFKVIGDENIPVLRYAVVYEWPEHPIAMEECIQTGKNIRPDQVTVVSTKGMPARCAHVYVMAADEEGNVKKAVYFEVFNHEFEADQWEPFSKGTMTEDFLATVFPTIFDVTDVPVEIEKHKTRKDFYRIVEPYKNHQGAAQYLSYGHEHQHYLYFDASDPENVYIERSPLGVEVLESEVYLSHDWSDLLWMWGSDDYESDKNFFELYFGVSCSGSTFKDGVLTFAPSAGLYVSLSGGALYDVNVERNPEYNRDDHQAAIDAGKDYNVAPYLPGKFKLVIDKLVEESGVAAVEAVKAGAEVYDLQGRRVQSPAKGLYIVNGKKVVL